MGVLEELALGGADRVERTLGKRPALRALTALRETLPAGEQRASATLRTIVLAVELDERAAWAGLIAGWSVTDGARHLEVRRSVGRLLAGGYAAAALALAESERARCAGGIDEPGAHYLRGRALEAGGELTAAAAAYAHVGEVAARQPRLVRAARTRRARVLAATGDAAGAAAEASGLLDELGALAPEDRLTIGALALASPGRYRRAAALDALEGVAAGGDARLRSLAIARAVTHAERAGAALTRIELDRALAVLAHHPDAAARASAQARLEASFALTHGQPEGPAMAARADARAARSTRRAAAVLEGSAPGPRPTDEADVGGWLALEAVHRARAGQRREALDALRELTERVRADGRAEAAMWTAAEAGLRVLPTPARALVRALLEADGDPPPRGFLALARALEAVGAAADAVPVLRRATLRREDGARAHLADHARAEGWLASARGDRDEALARLREARALYGGDA